MIYLFSENVRNLHSYYLSAVLKNAHTAVISRTGMIFSSYFLYWRIRLKTFLSRWDIDMCRPFCYTVFLNLGSADPIRKAKNKDRSSESASLPLLCFNRLFIFDEIGLRKFYCADLFDSRSFRWYHFQAINKRACSSGG